MGTELENLINELLMTELEISKDKRRQRFINSVSYKLIEYFLCSSSILTRASCLPPATVHSISKMLLLIVETNGIPRNHQQN